MQLINYMLLSFLALIVLLSVQESNSIPATLPTINKTTAARKSSPVLHPTKVTQRTKPRFVSATTTRRTKLPSATNSTANATATLTPTGLLNASSTTVFNASSTTVFNSSSTMTHTIKVRQVPTGATSLSPNPVMNGRRVAFSVTKATENLRAVAHIHFRDVLTNVGGGWDPAVSEFVAPHDGKYFFIFHAIGVNYGDFTMSLTKNGMREVTAYGTSTTFEHGSNSIILELKTLDKISLELHQGAIYENPGNDTYTSFTGFLLSSV